LILAQAEETRLHELSITQNLLDLALRHAEQAGATRITHLHLVIGDLSSVIDDSVAFYWDMISKDTLAEGAKLHFERIPARMRCNDCQQEYQIKPGELACPRCGSAQVTPCAGTEFLLNSIEIEAADTQEDT
jgi:hydrogenase nickel incorporation protein HypA/HybF